jgi:AAA family ATP:ADP antiporter
MPRRKPSSITTRIAERLFGTVIYPHERAIVAILVLDLFVLMAVYYVLKVVRDPLVLMEGGVVGRNAARGAQALVLLGAIPAYGALANRIPPRTLVVGVFGFFLVTLLLFPVLAAEHVPVGFVFFVWLGIFSITVVAQFWSLSADLFTEEAGKRLFAPIATGGTLGAIAGAQLVTVLDRWLGPITLIEIAAVLFAVCLWLTHVVRRKAEHIAPVAKSAAEDDPPDLEGPGGFRLVAGDRYLLLIALAVILSNSINTTGDQIMAMVVDRHAQHLTDGTSREQFLMSYYGNFHTWVSVVTAAIQVIAVTRIVKLVGLRWALMFSPMIALGGYGVLATMPVLMLARVVKVADNSADYSLQNTLQQMLFLPTSRAAKYKAKAATDTFFVRFGDLLSWGTVSLALALSWNERTISLINVSAAGVWFGVALLLGWWHHQRLPRESSSRPGERASAGNAMRPEHQHTPA